jgi:hypothetical protein
MAVCTICKLEMTDSATVDCTGNREIEYPDGTTLPALQYAGDDRCHDCYIVPGGYHHLGCDMERCPRCAGQLVSCGCLDTDDNDYSEDDDDDQDAR